jgi:hypothetical protein
MSKFKFLVILVKSVTNQAIKANNQESAMKFLARITFRAPHTYTLEETIEWNRLVSSAIMAQHEPFSDQENLDWGLMVDAARFHQVGIPSTLSQAYAEMGMGLETEADEWDYSDPGFSDECPCMGSVDHCHRCEPPIETCTVCNNDKFVGKTKVESPFVCSGCQEKTKFHLGLMKSDKEWEERQEKDLLDYLPF